MPPPSASPPWPPCRQRRPSPLCPLGRPSCPRRHFLPGAGVGPVAPPTIGAVAAAAPAEPAPPLPPYPHCRRLPDCCDLGIDDVQRAGSQVNTAALWRRNRSLRCHGAGLLPCGGGAPFPPAFPRRPGPHSWSPHVAERHLAAVRESPAPCCRRRFIAAPAGGCLLRS